MNETKNWPNSVFTQKSSGAEPDPPIEIECYNGSIVLSQGQGFVSLSPESLNELFEKIKGLNSTTFSLSDMVLFARWVTKNGQLIHDTDVYKWVDETSKKEKI